jgi:xeroderma pigmentosum group C-complementing protein
VVIGIVIAVENESLVKDAWAAEETLRVQKEATKKQKEILSRWKKFLVGLRIRKRINHVYGDKSPSTGRDDVVHNKSGNWVYVQEITEHGALGEIENGSNGNEGLANGTDGDDGEDREDTGGGFILD